MIWFLPEARETAHGSDSGLMLVSEDERGSGVGSAEASGPRSWRLAESGGYGKGWHVAGKRLTGIGIGIPVESAGLLWENVGSGGARVAPRPGRCRATLAAPCGRRAGL